MVKIKLAQSENFGMGTVITNRVFGEMAEEALQAALQETSRLERLLSRFIRDSDISRINVCAGTGCQGIGSETCELLLRSLEFSERCNGSFDVTIGPLAALWSGARESSEPPCEAEIADALPLVGYRDLALDPREGTAALGRSGQSIDLGGIGKGYAADKVLDIYRKFGIGSAFTNFGGNVAVIGVKPDGSPWRIGIRHPRSENGLIGVITTDGRSVVTSGDYQRYFIGVDGKRYHHILDPKTGYPAESGLVSVTVVADSSVAADALSTALFVAGMEQGVDFLDSYPGTEAVFVGRDLSVHVTGGLRGSFQPNKGIEVNWMR
ncbi:MAG TPA: FAD:protein FMN transferase [Clostridia bacterium]|nr:FAD:protein FMN transferase [Clostridia bacterium]